MVTIARHGQSFQELRDSRDLVGLLIDFHLSQHQPIGARPGADYVDGGFADAAVMRTPQHFPIDRNHLPVNHLAHRTHPTQKTGLELLRVQAGKYSRKRVMRRDAVGQLQKRPKPFQPGFAKLFDIFPVIGACDHRTDGDDQNIQQLVQLGAIDARIGQVAKVVFDRRQNFIFHR